MGGAQDLPTCCHLPSTADHLSQEGLELPKPIMQQLVEVRRDSQPANQPANQEQTVWSPIRNKPLLASKSKHTVSVCVLPLLPLLTLLLWLLPCR